MRGLRLSESRAAEETRLCVLSKANFSLIKLKPKYMILPEPIDIYQQKSWNSKPIAHNVGT